MTIKCKELRLSLVWSKAFSKTEWMPDLSDSGRYKQEFEQARQQKGEWLLPWQPGERQHFWQYYLHISATGDLGKITAADAWDHLVPLRAPSWAQVDNLPAGVERVGLEGFCFPHCVGVIATLFLPFARPLSLTGAVDQAVEARHYKLYGVAWRGEAKRSHGNLHSLANELIDRLHARVLGGTPLGLPLSEPITIATVIDAAGVGEAWSARPSREGAALNRALYGLCLLKRGWKKGDLSGLLSRGMEPLDPRSGPGGDRLLALERGRAIWRPEYFAESFEAEQAAAFSPRLRTLGCYHRNLALAALQTRGLIHLTRRAREFLVEKKPVPLQISNAVKNAVGLLNRLYLGYEETYRSWSVRYHIEKNLDLIQQVAAAVGIAWEEEEPEPPAWDEDDA